jgi:hypothetical protein
MSVTVKNVTQMPLTFVVTADPEIHIQRVIKLALAASVVIDDVVASASPDLYLKIANKQLEVTVGSMPSANYNIALSDIGNLQPESGAVGSAVTAHASLTTGVHGVGGGTVAKVADIATNANLSISAQAAITASHGVNDVNSSAEPAGAVATAMGKIVAYLSAASVGSTGATETLAVTGLEATDTILAVSAAVVGATPANCAVSAFGAPGAASLSVTWIGDPGAGAKVLVLVKKV